MADEKNNDLRWLIEQSHKAYLAWIALWLACVLGIVSVLTTISSKPDVLIPCLVVYVGLVSAMIFSVYRVSNIISEQITWANQITRKFLREQLLSHRGKLSKIVVNDRGELCELNRNLACLLQVIVPALLLLIFLTT